MIAKLAPGSSVAAKAAIIRHIEGHGLRVHVGESGARTVVSIIGNPPANLADELAAFPEVESVTLDAPSYPLVSLGSQPGPSIVKVNSVAIGDQSVVVIAGPCSVESAEQLLAIADGVSHAGAVMLRGGAFKPRTSPYSFQGLGVEGLELLKQARDKTGMQVVSECVAPEDVATMVEYVDMIQIGARNMQNFRLLSAVGEQPSPVLLKRGMMSTIDEFLLAAEYIMSSGNPRVVLCERGIRSFDTSTRSTLDISAVPVLKEMTHLPVIVDPSHAAGRRSLVPSLAAAGVAAGADGLIVEVHNRPDQALSDGAQSLTIEGFEETMKTVAKVANAVGRTFPATDG
jgi:3-deoxy-7-phosphoheptulonate synthase